ncbi:MAG TPA: S9 family peptidase [Steroidobacteraceae bacterium]|nr:S9 family peptidase [Steroidobacteraceae bacterium]
MTRLSGTRKSPASHAGIAAWAAALVFAGTGMGSWVSRAAAAPMAPDRNGARIAAIMQRLRDVQSFEAVSVAPNGKTVAWVVTEKSRGDGADAKPAKGKDGKTGAAADGGKPGQILQMADAHGANVRTVTIAQAAKSCRYSNLRWSPDGRTLAFLSNCNHAASGDDQFDIYEVSGGSIGARRMSHLHGLVNQLAWTPNGSELSFLYVEGDVHPVSAVSATKALVGVIGETGVERQRIAEMPAGGGNVSQITPAGVFIYEYDWSPTGDRLAYVGAPPPGRDNWWTAKLYTQTPGGTPKVTLDPPSVTGPLHGLQIAVPRWSPDGTQIAFIGGLMSDQGSTGGDIYLIAAEGGEPVDVTSGIDFSPSWLTWSGKHTLLVSSVAGGSTRLSVFALHGNMPAEHHPLFTVDAGVGDGTLASAVSVSARHDVLSFIDSTFDSPPEIYLATLKTRAAGPVRVAESPRAITHVNAGVQPMWGKAVSVSWHNEGFQVQGWLLFPPNYDPHKRYPMVVYVHGGPSAAVRPMWPRDGYGAAPLAAMGYFVLMPNPRGSFGQGERFAAGVRLNMGYGDLRDILAGVNQVEAQYPIDDSRLGLTGWSYGGFMSMFAPTQTHRFKAAVVGAGLSDWESYYGENSIDEWMLPFFGASVYQDPAAYAKSSAIGFIRNDKTPSLIVVGEFDGECPAPQSFEYWHALRAMGVPTTLVVYAGEGHGFDKPADERDVLLRALRWFGKYLGNETAAQTAGIPTPGA